MSGAGQQPPLPGIDPPIPGGLTQASSWYWGGQGSRSGVWLQRHDHWKFWTWEQIGVTAEAEVTGPIRRAWFVPTRCRDALDDMHAHGSWVDRALGAQPPNDVDQWEAGRLLPTRHQIRRLVWLTGRTVDYFCPEGGTKSILYGFACVRPAGLYLIEIRTVTAEQRQ